MGAAAELAAVASSLPPSFPACATISASPLLLPRVRLSRLNSAGEQQPPARSPRCRDLTWLGRHEPSPGRLQPPVGAQGPPGAPPPLSRRRRTFSGRNSKLRPSSALFFRPGTSRSNST